MSVYSIPSEPLLCFLKISDITEHLLTDIYFPWMPLPWRQKGSIGFFHLLAHEQENITDCREIMLPSILGLSTAASSLIECHLSLLARFDMALMINEMEDFNPMQWEYMWLSYPWGQR